ncbi:hypothetical protein FNF29_07782 [Cafeteria roenbergensis]|uniref:Phosphoinositide phospholipase C n=1 Tax=Cafeteria roenbergensis TaxID=33653 RepID=A0A5A8C1B5_CAFRO|nr:hypothetical protein FNF29_07782 [Cafeteria roenbergensis]|eukprot:KAA0146806.1 hypothetical protein FNF29_07782 [Cafeteria roenbergensis]
MGICMARQAGAETFEGSDRYTSGPLAHSASPIEPLIASKWKEMDRDGSGSLSFSELQALLVALNIVITDKVLKAKFEKFDTSKDGELSLDEFRQLFNAFNDKPGPEIDALFTKYARDGLIHASGFAAFLRDEQGEAAPRGVSPQALLDGVKAKLAAMLAKTAAGGGDDAAEAARRDAALARFSQATKEAAEEEQSAEARHPTAAGPAAKAPDAVRAAAAAPTPSPAKGGGPSEEADEVAVRRRAATAAASDVASKGALSFQEFAAYITSPALNSPLAPTTHDMSHPLSSYFVSSTHNSYLSGNQLHGRSTADAIRRALALGARVIELDCYSANDAALGTAEPWVTHGGTLTGKLPFREAVRAVAEYAFRPENVIPSDAPVILTLENHCSKSGQSVQAAILREELGDLLHVPPAERPAVYPSPESMRGKVLIRDKPGRPLEYAGASEAAEAAAAEAADQDDADPDDDQAEQEAAQAAAIAAQTAAESGAPLSAAAASAAATPATVQPKVLHPDLMALVAVPNMKFRGFHKLASYCPGPASSSFSEDLMAAAAKGAKLKGSPSSIAELAKTHLLRVYPKGVRVDSSNFSPGRFWALGCQLAALNYQYGDRSVHTNQAFFSQNGGCGYVLKPAWMRSDGPIAPFHHSGSPSQRRPTGTRSVKLTVTVISAHFLPKPREYKDGRDIIDPFVEVRVAGAPADEACHTTGVISDNGFNPCWVDPAKPSLKPTATFTVGRPDVAVLTFSVSDKNLAGSVIVAQAGVPLAALRTGTRAIALLDSLSLPLPATKLIVRIRATSG